MAPDASALVKKLEPVLSAEQDELASIAGLEARRRRPLRTPRSSMSARRVTTRSSCRRGWACAYKLLPDGGRRVIDFSVPGDFMGLRSGANFLRTSDHGFAAVGDIVVAEVSARQMIDLLSADWGRRSCGRPRATRRWWSSILVNIGRRSALVRTAHLLLELGLRLQLVGLGSDNGFVCPLNQYLMARCAGAYRHPREPRPAAAARA